MQQRR
jgi:hypothetical protein